MGRCIGSRRKSFDEVEDIARQPLAKTKYNGMTGVLNSPKTHLCISELSSSALSKRLVLVDDVCCDGFALRQFNHFGHLNRRKTFFPRPLYDIALPKLDGASCSRQSKIGKEIELSNISCM